MAGQTLNTTPSDLHFPELVQKELPRTFQTSSVHSSLKSLLGDDPGCLHHSEHGQVETQKVPSFVGPQMYLPQEIHTGLGNHSLGPIEKQILYLLDSGGKF